jgi:hypothetical protein
VSAKRKRLAGFGECSAYDEPNELADGTRTIHDNGKHAIEDLVTRAHAPSRIFVSIVSSLEAVLGLNLLRGLLNRLRVRLWTGGPFLIVAGFVGRLALFLALLVGHRSLLQEVGR